MKRASSIILAFVLLFSIASCRFNDDQPELQTEETTDYEDTSQPTTARLVINAPPIDVTKSFKIPCTPEELLSTLEALNVPIITPKESCASYDPDYDDEAHWRGLIENYVNDGRFYKYTYDGSFGYFTADGDGFHFSEAGKLISCDFYSMRFSSGEGVRIGDSLEKVQKLYRLTETIASPPNHIVFDATTKDGVYIFYFEDGELKSWLFGDDIKILHIMFGYFD